MSTLSEELVGVIRETMQPENVLCGCVPRRPPKVTGQISSPVLITLFVTIGSRAPAMMIRQRDGVGTSEGVGKMIGSKEGKPGVKMAALFAYAAGATGILANLFLIAFYALQANQPENGTWLGSANDLVGSVSTALMIPVALVLSTLLPDRRRALITRVVGLSAMAVLVVGGPLLVFGVLAFEVQAPIAVGAGMFLFLWLLLINRWLRLSGALQPRVAQFGEFLVPVSWPVARSPGSGSCSPGCRGRS